VTITTKSTSERSPSSSKRWPPSRYRGWRSLVGVVNRCLSSTQSANSAEDGRLRAIKEAAKRRGVPEHVMEYLDVVADVDQCLVDHRRARSFRIVAVRALRPRGRARRARRVVIRRATADSGGSSDGDPEPPRSPGGSLDRRARRAPAHRRVTACPRRGLAFLEVDERRLVLCARGPPGGWLVAPSHGRALSCPKTLNLRDWHL